MTNIKPSESNEVAVQSAIAAFDFSDPACINNVTAVVVKDAVGVTHWFFAPATLSSSQDVPLVADGSQE